MRHQAKRGNQPAGLQPKNWACPSTEKDGGRKVMPGPPEARDSEKSPSYCVVINALTRSFATMNPF
jgi:hypothetical protein